MTIGEPVFMFFHDDESCGELLDKTGKCPACDFAPDAQSVAFRWVRPEEYLPLIDEGYTFLGLKGIPIG